MSEQNKQMMEELYLDASLFWELSDEKQEIALKEMQETYDRLLEASENTFDNLRIIVQSLAGYAKFINTILNS
jgi:hypothetical protein